MQFSQIHILYIGFVCNKNISMLQNLDHHCQKDDPLENHPSKNNKENNIFKILLHTLHLILLLEIE